MKLSLKIKNPADAYALRVVGATAAVVGFEVVLGIAAADEILFQVLAFTVLGAAGLHKLLKVLER